MNTISSDIKEFLQHCLYEKNLSPKTLKSYRIDLKQLEEFLIRSKLMLITSEITKSELRDYLDSISHLKPKSIKRKIATVRAMFNYLEFEDIIQINPLRKMRIRIKEPKQLPKVMDIREVGKIFKAAYGARDNAKRSYTHFECLRNIAVVELLFATGARVSEIAGLKLESIDLINGSVSIKGKGNKERLIQVCNKETLRILKEYYNFSKDKVNASGGYFLINRLGNKLSDQSIRKIIFEIHRAVSAA